MAKKLFKQLICLTLSAVMIMGMSFTAFATEGSTDSLSTIAANTIQTTESTDTSGTTTTTFTNLDTFIDTVHTTHPEMADYNIATYILQYTQQDYEDLSESEILTILDYDEITTSCSYVRVDDEGNSYVSNVDYIPYADWTSTDGYMKITTSYGHLKTVGSEKYYSVWARGTWLKYPAIAMQDAFVLGTSGTFDDRYTEYGSVSQTFYCLVCTNVTYRNRSVSKTEHIDGDLTLNYNNFVPTMHFTPISPRCDYCSGGAVTDSYFSTYIRYGMIANQSVNIQAAYAHKTFGFGNISVGIDITGTPSFSAGVSTISQYIARAVTVTY